MGRGSIGGVAGARRRRLARQKKKRESDYQEDRQAEIERAKNPPQPEVQPDENHKCMYAEDCRTPKKIPPPPGVYKFGGFVPNPKPEEPSEPEEPEVLEPGWARCLGCKEKVQTRVRKGNTICWIPFIGVICSHKDLCPKCGRRQSKW